MFDTITLETSGDGVATLTLNRPDRLNAFNFRMCEEFRTVWRTIREDESVRAVVLRANGRAFCTGLDVAEGWPKVPNSPFRQEDPGIYLGPKQNGVWKPLICAVNGMAAGGAFYWLNEADIVICGEDAHFFDPHVTFGLVAACEPVGALARVPLAEVMRMALMGNDERISAQTALRISLVTEVAAPADLWPRAHEIAAIIAAKPAAAIQGTVRAIWESLDLPRGPAITNALKYTQIGNPIGTAQVDRARVPKAKWRLR